MTLGKLGAPDGPLLSMASWLALVRLISQTTSITCVMVVYSMLVFHSAIPVMELISSSFRQCEKDEDCVRMCALIATESKIKIRGKPRQSADSALLPSLSANATFSP